MNRLIFFVVCLFSYSSLASAQEGTPTVDPIVFAASADLGCPVEGIRIMRRTPNGAILAVCGDRYVFHTAEDGQIRNLGIYTGTVVGPAPYRYTADQERMLSRHVQLRSHPEVWAPGLSIFIASWLISAGGTAAMVNQARSTSHLPSGTQLSHTAGFTLGTLPFLGPLIAVAHFNHADASEWAFSIVAGVVQIVSFILIGAGSRRSAVPGLRSTLDGVVASF